MNVGFNHNVMYKGDIFHIQTEDSGVKTPHIITLLYRGGTIISSKKTSYADIIKMENLSQVVEELMKEQHKDMLRRLKSGEFDARAFGDGTGQALEEDDGELAEEVGPDAVEPVATPAPVPPPPVAAPAVAAAPVVAAAAPPQPAAAPSSPERKLSLDEIILDYLVTGDDI